LHLYGGSAAPPGDAKKCGFAAQISIEHGTARSTQQHSLFVAALLHEAKSAVILTEAKDL
jgi:hypothetical protein